MVNSHTPAGSAGAAGLAADALTRLRADLELFWPCKCRGAEPHPLQLKRALNILNYDSSFRADYTEYNKIYIIQLILYNREIMRYSAATDERPSLLPPLSKY